MSFDNSFTNKVDEILKKGQENGSRLVIHGTTSFTNAYSILKNGFYFCSIESYDDEDDENLVGVNTVILSDTAMIIPKDDALKYVLNYSYDVNDKERGSSYSIIFRVPNEKIPFVNNIPDFCPKKSELNSYLDKKYVVAVIDKVKERVITEPTLALDFEYEEENEKLNEEKEKSFKQMTKEPSLEELEKIIKMLKKIDGDSELLHIMEKKIEKKHK